MKVICLIPPGPLPPIIPPFPEHWEKRVIHDEKALTDELACGAEAMLVATHFPIGREQLQRLQGVKLLQWTGVGADCIDLEAARELGVPVANVEGVNAVSVAEWVLMAMIHVMRRVDESIAEVRQGRDPWPSLLARGCHEIRGKKLGILGFGAIGHQVAIRAQAFGMEILTGSIPGREREADEREAEVGARRLDFWELLAESDTLSLHTPLTEETRGLFSESTLGHLKPGAILVNAARGDIVDENALARLLHAGHLAGAAVDTFSIEPIPVDHPLWEAPNALLTPHCGGNTQECVRFLAEESFENVNRVGRGEEPLYRLC